MRIAEELRCLVCQNQTIADSHADLAVDLRKQIREKLQQRPERRADPRLHEQRYGDFVLYRPPVKGTHRGCCGSGPSLLLLAWPCWR